MPAAPAPSTTTFSISRSRFIASSTDVSSTVTMSSTSSRTSTWVTEPATGTAMPSAIVGAAELGGDAGGRRHHRRPAVALGSHDGEVGAQRAGDDGHPAEQPSAARRDHQRIQLGVVVEQLQRHRPLTGDHGGVVVGVHERAALGGQPLGFLGGVGEAVAVQDDAGTEHLGALHLHERRVRGHHDGGLDAEPRARAGRPPAHGCPPTWRRRRSGVRPR